MRDIPHSPVALYEVANLFGTLIAETILASVHVRARKQAGHMGASDLIKALQNTLRGGGRPHTGMRVQSYLPLFFPKIPEEEGVAVHNTFLQIYFEMGLIGLAAFLAI